MGVSGAIIEEGKKAEIAALTDYGRFIAEAGAALPCFVVRPNIIWRTVAQLRLIYCWQLPSWGWALAGSLETKKDIRKRSEKPWGRPQSLSWFL